jgi:peroxiredoxin (alkyl hydroperoxide reductase subunit C)
MTAVGKKFPNITVNAMNDMGDTFSLNIFDQAVNKKRKFSFFGIPKILPLYAQLNCMHSRSP